VQHHFAEALERCRCGDHMGAEEQVGIPESPLVEDLHDHRVARVPAAHREKGLASLWAALVAGPAIVLAEREEDHVPASDLVGGPVTHLGTVVTALAVDDRKPGSVEGVHHRVPECVVRPGNDDPWIRDVGCVLLAPVGVAVGTIVRSVG